MRRNHGADMGNELKTEVNLKNIVGRIVDLPTLPKVVSHLLCAVEDPRSSAREINLIMSNDPALAARILKLVNSSFYAMPSPVTSIQQAVVILGFNTVRSLALSASVFDTFAGKSGFSHENFWLQSLTCALMCENLGARSDCLRIDSCFTLGLLHGIGKIILHECRNGVAKFRGNPFSCLAYSNKRLYFLSFRADCSVTATLVFSAGDKNYIT